MRSAVWIGLVTASCGGPATPVCGTAECAAICADEVAKAIAVVPVADPSKVALEVTPFEKGLLDSRLDDVRQGVRPWGPASLGVCAADKKRGCPAFLGIEAGELPPGEYQLFGEFRVPELGEPGSWKVHLEVDCQIVKVDGPDRTNTQRTRKTDFDVAYTGTEKGYRLSPMYQIKSPADGGPQSCKWTVTTPHPDGAKTWSGSWSVPGRR